MIGEGVLAIEMGALVEDLALTIHAHPTLTETEGGGCGAFPGQRDASTSRPRPLTQNLPRPAGAGDRGVVFGAAAPGAGCVAGPRHRRL